MNARTRSLADIRIVIGAVLSIIGLFLLICSAFLNGPEEMAKTGDVNANLWSGLGLVVIAVLMILWWTVDPGAKTESGAETSPGSGDRSMTVVPEEIGQDRSH